MSVDHDYRDGFVDVVNGAILTETGVRTVKYPRIVHVAERTGELACHATRMFTLASATMMGRAHLVEYAPGMNGEIKSPPDRLRAIGTGCLIAGAYVLSRISPEIAEATEAVAEGVQSYVQEHFVEPFARMGRMR